MTAVRRRGAFDPERLKDLDELLPPPPAPPVPLAPPASPDQAGAERKQAIPTAAGDPAAEPSPGQSPAASAPGPRPAGRRSGTSPDRRRPDGASREAAPEPAPGSRVSVAVYVPDDLKALLEREQARRGRNVTYAQLALEALSARVDEIDLRLQQEREAAAAVRARSSSSRFVPPPVRQQSLRGPGGRQVQLRLTVEEVAWLDGIRAELGAYSRSAVMAVALELKLAAPRPEDDRRPSG